MCCGSAAIRALTWRSDSRMLASGGEDGFLNWWDASDGWPAISKNNAHAPARPAGVDGKLASGVLAATFGPNGQLFTTGHDHIARLWDTSGNQLKTFEVSNALPIQNAVSHDGSILIAGDSTGRLHFWKTTKE